MIYFDFDFILFYPGFYATILENVDIEEIVDENGDNRTVTSFVSGVSISVAAVDQLLDISISAPDDFKNLTSGLMGEWVFTSSCDNAKRLLARITTTIIYWVLRAFLDLDLTFKKGCWIHQIKKIPALHSSRMFCASWAGEMSQ